MIQRAVSKCVGGIVIKPTKAILIQMQKGLNVGDIGRQVKFRHGL